jgi:hypothetical protein
MIRYRAEKIYGRICASILVFVVIISLTAFQAPEAIAHEVGDVETFNVTVPTVTTSNSLLYVLCDPDALEYVPGSLRGIGDAQGLATEATLKFTYPSTDPMTADNGEGFVGETGYYFNNIKGIRNMGGEILQFQLKVKSGVSSGIHQVRVVLVNHTGATVSPTSITVGSGGDNDLAAYAITPTTTDTGVTEGSEFGVALTLTADPADAAIGSAYAELTYTGASHGTLPADVSENGTGKLKISYGPAGGAAGVVPGPDGLELAAIPFTAGAEGTATFTVTEGVAITYVVEPGTGGKEIPAGGGTLSVTIGAAAPDYTDGAYVNLPDTHKLIKYQISASDAAFVWTYGADGAAMHYYTDGADHYVTYIVESGAATYETATKTATPRVESRDVSGDGNVRISDAQIVYDIINNHLNYGAISGLDIAVRLAADVNNDGVVDAADVTAIKNAVHGIS